MNAAQRSEVRVRIRNGDGGFTLIELLVAMVLAAVIAGVVVAALITSLNVANSTTALVNDSTDAGLITSFLTRDAQSAGAIVPTTAARDTTLGISTDTSLAAWGDCTPPTSFILRLGWIDRTVPASITQPGTRVVVYYFINGAAQLTRRACKSGVSTDVVLGSHLVTAVASCDTGLCAGSPTWVSLAVTGSGSRAPLSYTLKASLRGDTEVPPTVSNSVPVPLLALGAGAAVVCPNLEMAGTGAVTVVGNVLVDGLCGSGPIIGNQTLLQPTGTTSTISGIVDPFVARIPPTYTCPASGGVNPTTIGLSASASTVVVYPLAVNLTVDTPFQAGRYVFCKGLTLTSGRISGSNVLLYVVAGTFEAKPAATVDLTGNTTVDANMLVWLAATDTNQLVKIAGGLKVSSYRGQIYAPTSRMEISSAVALNVGGINTQGLKVSAGAGQARVGLPLPPIGFQPATLPAGQANVGYSQTLVASGGTSPYTPWSATGLPSGLTMTTAGVISGTPTGSGTFPVVVTTFDSTQIGASMDYSLTIKAPLTIDAAPLLPNGQVNVGYAPTTLTASGGTLPYAWAPVSGMPPGLAINSSTGAVTGTPTAAGTFTTIVKVTDAVAASFTKSYTIVIGVKKSYFDTINETVGLVSYWRLGEASTGASTDTFTGTAGATLQTHTGDTGATWTKPSVGTWADAVITSSTGRIRKGGTTPSVAMYYSSAVPSSADYAVAADVIVTAVPLPTNDAIGVVGRLDPTATPSGAYYQAYYELSSQKWTLAKRTTAGGFTWIGQTNVTSLAAGTYHLTLDMNGSTIRLLVNGTQLLSVVDASITAAGRAGVILGWNNQDTTDTDTTGLQLDNFSVSAVSPALADSSSSGNIGSYVNSPTLGVVGAIAGDTNTAVTFDGANDYATVARQISDDFSIEFWFKSTQGIGLGTTWTTGAGLVDASVSGVANDFGVSLRSDGKILAGVGPGADVSILSTTGGYNNGAWHHVVFTRTKSTGALALYVDGLAKGSATGSTVSLTAATTMNFGRIEGGATNYYAGSLDEVAVYNTVLTPAIVTAHFNAAS